MLASIETYVDAVFEVDLATVERLRKILVL
jgi:hypothetical protein